MARRVFRAYLGIERYLKDVRRAYQNAEPDSSGQSYFQIMLGVFVTNPPPQFSQEEVDGLAPALAWGYIDGINARFRIAAGLEPMPIPAKAPTTEQLASRIGSRLTPQTHWDRGVATLGAFVGDLLDAVEAGSLDAVSDIEEFGAELGAATFHFTALADNGFELDTTRPLADALQTVVVFVASGDRSTGHHAFTDLRTAVVGLLARIERSNG